MKTTQIGNVTVLGFDDNSIGIRTKDQNGVDLVLDIDPEPIGVRMEAVRALAVAVLTADTIEPGEADIEDAARNMLKRADRIVMPSEFTGAVREHICGQRYRTTYYYRGTVEKIVTDPQSYELYPSRLDAFVPPKFTLRERLRILFLGE